MQEADLQQQERGPELPHCSFENLGYCVTCSDEAIPAQVVSIEPASGMAVVQIGQETAEVDVTLVEQLAPEDWVLVHGGVAIATLEEGNR
jgi:hydrogenase assembly chaperone HypC/HupF